MLDWNDNNPLGLLNYKVYRATGAGARTLIATVSSSLPPPSTYTDSSVASGTQYTYDITATNQAGEGAPSGTVTVTTDLVSWATIPTITVERTGSYPKYINNVRAQYLIDPGSKVTSVGVEDTSGGNITYESANDRIRIVADPGSDTIYNLRMYADYDTAQTGLVFPSNGDSPSTAFVAFQFSSPPGIWGPANAGMTYVWKYQARQQNGYYATFWYSRGDGVFDGGNPAYDAYYGAHPYPYPPRGGNSNPNHVWELAGMADGVDYLGTGTGPEPESGGNAAAVANGTWYTQALRITVNGNGTKTARFYFRLPAVGVGDYIERTSISSYGSSQPRTPRITFGDSPWFAQYGNERLSGILRHVKIFTGALSEADILARAQDETNTVIAADSRIWYSNVNPTPSDISDKSGRGNNPAWAGATIATLWSSGTVAVVPAYTNGPFA